MIPTEDALTASATELPVIEMIAAAARSTPDAVALRHDGVEITYRALLAAADGLAEELSAAGVGPDSVVGVYLTRSAAYVVAILAAARAGAAFMPLDPDWPADRLQFVLQNSRAAVVVTSPERRQLMTSMGAMVLCPDAPNPRSSRAGWRPFAQTDADRLAYVIYTSGSTGEPKGVEITQRNLTHLVSWHREAFGVTRSDRASCLAGLGFDAAVWEIWPYLAAGACISLVPDSTRASPDALRRWLVEERITMAFVPTPLAEPMITSPWPAGTALRYLLTGGDTLHTRPVAGLPFTVVNNYGPTECTVVATSGVVPPGGHETELPPIGRPIAGTQVHILSADGEPVREGEIGEIHIGGAGVGRGYRQRPDLTDELFIPDHLSTDNGNGRLYRTGDLGKRLPDGQIAFHGRRDNQVKIRGHRIELDEIAVVLDRHAQVFQSVVVGLGEGAEKRLVAYIVPMPGATLAARELRGFLSAHLPEYMLPSAFVCLLTLPLTASGKVDRASLPAPTAANRLADAAYRAPSSIIEEKLAGIVAELLGVSQVGSDDNFFLLGGHSLLGTQLVLRARDVFGAELTLRDLFQAQTISKLAAKIEQAIIERLDALSEEEASRLLAS